MQEISLSSLPDALTWPLGLVDGPVHVRRWLMDGGDPSAVNEEGLPTWAQAFMAGHPDAALELMEAGADLNLRDAEGNGWLHWTLRSSQSIALTLRGFSKLDGSWHRPNREGQTPFHLPCIPLPIGQAMAARFWAERRSWSLLTQHGDPIALAEQEGQVQLAQTWRYWKSRCKA